MMTKNKHISSKPRKRVVDHGTPCPECGCRFDHRVTHTRSKTRRRMVCGGCGEPFTVIRAV